MHSNDYRKAAILLYEHSGSMRHVSKVLKVSVSTVCRWLKRSVHAIWPKGRAGKITDQLIDFVRSTLTQNPSTHASRVACAFENSTGIKVSRQLISLIISTRLNMSYKRVRKRGIPSRLDLHADRINEFKAAFVSAYDAGSLACCDESGFDHRARPIYGYAVKSKQCVLTVPYSKCKHIHYTLTQGIHMDGSTHHSFKEGSNRAVDFEGFLTSLPFDSGTVLVLDNSSLHKTKQVRAIAETKGVKLLYTPPYTPEYNPIELLFGSVKCAFYKTRYSSHFGDDVKECARICVDRMTTTECVQGCFRHVSDLIRAYSKRNPKWDTYHGDH